MFSILPTHFTLIRIKIHFFVLPIPSSMLILVGAQNVTGDDSYNDCLVGEGILIFSDISRFESNEMKMETSVN